MGLWRGGCSAVPACRVVEGLQEFSGVGRGFAGAGLTREPPSTPAEGHVSRAVAPLLHQWLVKLSAGSRVDAGPAVLAVVLQTGDVGAEEWCKLAAAASSLALIAQLVIQHVWLHFHLQPEGGII